MLVGAVEAVRSVRGAEAGGCGGMVLEGRGSVRPQVEPKKKSEVAVSDTI